MKRFNGIGIGSGGPWRTSSSRQKRTPSPFFWWIRALLLAGAALMLFPIVFALVVKVGGLIAH